MALTPNDATKCLPHLTSLAEAVQPRNSVLARFYRNRILLKKAEIPEQGCNACGWCNTRHLRKNVTGQCRNSESLGRLRQILHENSPFVCTFCGNSMSHDPGSFTVRFRPKTSLTAKLLRLLVRAQNGEKLGKFHLNLIAKYRNSAPKMVVKCGVCGKPRAFAGPSREALVRQTTGRTGREWRQGIRYAEPSREALVRQTTDRTGRERRQDERLNVNAAKAPLSKEDKKRENKRLKKQRQRKKLLNGNQSDLQGSLNADSSLTLTSPLTASAPNPGKCRQVSGKSLVQSKGSPLDLSHPKGGQKKSTNQNVSTSSLLATKINDNSDDVSLPSTKKRKTKQSPPNSGKCCQVSGDSLGQSKGSPLDPSHPKGSEKKQKKSTNQNVSASSLLATTINDNSDDVPLPSTKKRKTKQSLPNSGKCCQVSGDSLGQSKVSPLDQSHPKGGQKKQKKLTNQNISVSSLMATTTITKSNNNHDVSLPPTKKRKMQNGTSNPGKCRQMSCDSFSQSKGSLLDKSHLNGSQKKQKKSTNQNLSLSSLLATTAKSINHDVPLPSTKKRKAKNMHLQLQKLIKKDKKNRESSGSLKDFLSSV